MTSWLHAERLTAVLAAVRESGARRVLDLGCGDGDLFVRLAQDPRIEALIGLDIDADALRRLETRLAAAGVDVPRVDVRLASMIDPPPDLAGYDCAVLVETIEHIDPDKLSKLENALFRTLRPGRVVVTTPNAEFNPLLGVPPQRMRHPDHRFEWDRAKFRKWGRRVAGVAGHDVHFHDIAGAHPDLGGASQMAVFARRQAG